MRIPYARVRAKGEKGDWGKGHGKGMVGLRANDFQDDELAVVSYAALRRGEVIFVQVIQMRKFPAVCVAA